MILDKITVTKLETFDNIDGNVMRGIRNLNSKIITGELYFSWINNNSIKAWKKNCTSSSRFIVPCGLVKFVFFSSNKESLLREEIIGESRYSLIEIPSNIWYGFKGISKNPSLICNLIEDVHNKNNMKNKNLEEINYNW